MVPGKLDIHMQKTETRSLSLSLHKNELQVDHKDLNVRPGMLTVRGKYREQTSKWRHRKGLSE